MKKNIAKFILVSTMIAGCGHHKEVSDTAKATAPNLMEARVIWLKDKKADKYDFQFSLTNESSKGVIVYLNDIECMKGNVTGTVKHTFFNTGERTIDFKPGQNKKFNMACHLPQDVESKDFKIIVKRISEDQNNDGRIAGKVLYRDLTVPVTL